VLAFENVNRRKIWQTLVAAVGLEEFHWHDLRHTFAHMAWRSSQRHYGRPQDTSDWLEIQ